MIKKLIVLNEVEMKENKDLKNNTEEKIKSDNLNNEQKTNKKENKKCKIEKIDIFTFLMPFIIFLIALLSFFPGILTNDPVDQINQAQTNNFYHGHPYIVSIFFGTLTTIGGKNGTYLVVLVQIIIFSLIWSYSCKTLRKYNNTRKNKIFQVIITIILSIMPLNFLYSITLWKDILYSYNFILLITLTYVGMRENYKYTKTQIILLVLACIVIMKFRFNGYPIGLISIIFLAFMSFMKNKDKKILKTFIISFIVIDLIFTLPTKFVNDVTEEGSYSNVLDSTKVCLLAAMLNDGLELNDEEKDVINNIMNVDSLKENYNPYNGGTIFYSDDYNDNWGYDENTVLKFREIFNKYAKYHKLAIIKYFEKVNSIWWSIDEKYGMHSVITTNDWIHDKENGRYDTKPILKNANKFLTDYTVWTMKTKTRYNLNYRPAVPLIVSLVIVIMFSIKNKNGKYLILAIPMILNIGTYIFLITSQDQRYFYPNFTTEYALILIFGIEFIKTKKLKKAYGIDENISDELKKTKNPKTLIIIPAYNEEKSIEKVVNSVYNEKIENLDVIVINDGSKDNTLKEARKTKAIVIDSPNNLGIGGAVQTGYLYAYQNDYDIAIQIDGDGQHDPKYLRKIIDNVKNGYDMVIGSRFIEKTTYDQTFMRMLGIRIISNVIKNATNVKVYDTTSGYRAANKNVIKEFVLNYPYDYPEPCTTMNMIKKGYKIREIPVEMKKREQGKSSISPLKSVSYMFKVILYLTIKGSLE